jgi:hypothetical protein
MYERTTSVLRHGRATNKALIDIDAGEHESRRQNKFQLRQDFGLTAQQATKVLQQSDLTEVKSTVLQSQAVVRSGQATLIFKSLLSGKNNQSQ